jgi:site-specific DNA recombinase
MRGGDKAMRCAIYARYSTDQQRPESIEDQIRKCREFANRRGWTVLEDHIYSDSAVSGASTLGRVNFLRMVEVAKSKPKPFDYILVDDTKRFARDVVTLIQNYKILKFYGVQIFFVSDGIDGAQSSSQLLVTIYAGVGEQDLEYIAKTTHRGLEGQAKKGFNTGGKVYGYTSVPVYSGDKDRYGNPVAAAYEMKINPKEAAVVRRIFEEYAAGKSPREIVKQFNKERIASPRAKWRGGKRSWTYTALTGDRSKGLGILNNEIYIGRKIWNKSTFRKNPETGKRVRQMRPKDEWVIKELPKLQIVSDELWHRVKARQNRIRRHFEESACGFQSARREYDKNLLSGMLKCECGAHFIIVAGSGDPYYGCSFHRNRGDSVCSNQLRVRRSVLEESVLELLSNEILQQYLPALVEEVNLELRQSRTGSIAARDEILARMEETDAKIENIKEAIERGAFTDTTTEMLRKAEEEKAALVSQLEELRRVSSQPFPRVSEKTVAAYVKNLRELMYVDPRAARMELQKHIESITLTRNVSKEGKESLEISVKVIPDGILQVLVAQSLTIAPQMVAGGGFEPPTFGL